eukprot:799018-Alexandrium_andersonii.AAC.1
MWSQRALARRSAVADAAPPSANAAAIAPPAARHQHYITALVYVPGLVAPVQHCVARITRSA